MHRWLVVALAWAGGVAAAAPAARTEVFIDGPQTSPESITSTEDGTLFTGSVGLGGVFKTAPGASRAASWIPSGVHGLQATLGLLADEAGGLLWVCTAKMSPGPAGPTPTGSAVYAFDLRTGDYHASFPLPGEKALCNDIAIGPDKAAYISDTLEGRVLRLAPGGSALTIWAQTPELAGANGLTFLGRDLYVNSYFSGQLIRFGLGAGGEAGPGVVLTTSRPLRHPDGMRAIGARRIVLAEGEGSVDLLTVSGDKVEVRTLRDGLSVPVSVTRVQHTAWVLEGKALPSPAPGTGSAFRVTAVPLP